MKPKLMQKGPYAYDEYYVKFDISWSDNGNKVSFNTQKYYVFNSERTGPGLSYNDSILLPYPIVIAFEYYLSQISNATNILLDEALNSKLNTQEDELETTLSQLEAALKLELKKDPDNPKNTTYQALLAKVQDTEVQVSNLFDYLHDFTKESNSFDLLLKVIISNTNIYIYISSFLYTITYN